MHQALKLGKVALRDAGAPGKDSAPHRRGGRSTQSPEPFVNLLRRAPRTVALKWCALLVSWNG